MPSSPAHAPFLFFYLRVVYDVPYHRPPPCFELVSQSSRKERDAMLAANQAAVNTVQQLAKMHQRLEMQQLEKIRDICEAALEDMDSVPDKVK